MHLKDLIKSPLWRKPPLYKQIYLWLAIGADHAGFRVEGPTWGVVNVERGEVFFTMGGLAGSNWWYERKRKEVPSMQA